MTGGLTLLYEDRNIDTGLMTKANLLKMYEFERFIEAHPMWNQLCRAQDDHNKTCHNTTSYSTPLKLFEDVKEFNLTDLKQISQFQINRGFRRALTNPRIWPRYKFFFDSNVTVEEPRVTFMRTFFNAGGPLEIRELNGTVTRYKNVKDFEDDQNKVYKNFAMEVFEKAANLST